MAKSVAKCLICLGLVLGLLGTTFTAPAMAAPEYKWTFSQPWVRPLANKVYKQFCDNVKKYSNGRIEIKLYVDGLLGNHDETFHGVQDGTITVGCLSPYVKLIPGGVLNWMPWTTSSWEEYQIAFKHGDGVLFKVLEKAYNEVGMHTLFHVSQGAYGLGNTVRPIRNKADFKNMKLRVSGSLGLVRALEGMGKGTGMTLTTLPWSDIYNAMSRGVVDGCWSMYPSLVEERHYEVMKFFSDVNFCWDNQNVIMNKEIWDELPEDLKGAVDKAAIDAQVYADKLHREAEAKYIAKLEKQKGFTIVRLTDAERAAFLKDSNVPAIWKELCDPWLEKAYPGQNMSQKIRDELALIRDGTQARRNPRMCRYSPSYPAALPHVVSVGATQGPELESREIACSSDQGGLITSGGGFSTVFKTPKWQKEDVSKFLQDSSPAFKGYNEEGRGYPDVSVVGRNYAVCIGSKWYTVSGTSASAPVFAGMLSLVNGERLKAGKPPLGFVTPALYSISRQAFHDIKDGRNNCCVGRKRPTCCDEGFNAVTGWDPVTGLGSIDYTELARELIEIAK